MRNCGMWVAVVFGAIGIGSIAGAPVAAALPNCGMIAPQTMQCERGTSTSINTSPNPAISPGPYLQQPWLYGGYPAGGIGGWAVP